MVILVLGLLAVVVVIVIYNNSKNFAIRLDQASAQIFTAQAKLNKVYAEVSNLLKKYSIHEASLVNNVAAGQSNLQVLASKYPQLQADGLYLSACSNCDKLFSELQTNISHYNNIITAYNIYVTFFPRVIVCSQLGFKSKIHAKIT